jgi:hypothetical protein
MSKNIYVCEGGQGRSVVVGDGSSLPVYTFVHKGHAVAYARALAFSLGLPLWVYGDDSVMVLEPSASLTYPKHLV